MVDIDLTQKPMDEDTIGATVIKRLVGNRRKLHKNTFFSICGGSGEGKSSAALRIAEILDDNFKAKEQVIYHPQQFMEKVRSAKENKYKVLILDEAQTTVDSKLYYSFINRAITYVTSTFRQIHQLVLIIIAPNVNWVEKRIREQVNYYCVAYSNIVSNRKRYSFRMYEVGFNYYDLRDQSPYLKKVVFRIKYVNKYGRTLFKVQYLKEMFPRLANEKILREYKEISGIYKEGLIEKQLNDLMDHFKEKGKDKLDPSEICDKIMQTKKLLKAVTRQNKNGETVIQKTTVKRLFNLNELDYIDVQDMLEKRLDKNSYGGIPVK